MGNVSSGVSHNATDFSLACEIMPGYKTESVSLSWTTDYEKAMVRTKTDKPRVVNWIPYLAEALPPALLDDFAKAYDVDPVNLMDMISVEFRSERSKRRYNDFMVAVFDNAQVSNEVCWPTDGLENLVSGYRSHLGAMSNLMMQLDPVTQVKQLDGAPADEFNDKGIHCLANDDPYYDFIAATINREGGSWDFYKHSPHPFLRAFGKGLRWKYSCDLKEGCPRWLTLGKRYIPYNLDDMVKQVQEMLALKNPVCIMLSTAKPPPKFISIDASGPAGDDAEQRPYGSSAEYRGPKKGPTARKASHTSGRVFFR